MIFFLAQEVSGFFFWPERLLDLFWPYRLRDIFLPKRLRDFVLGPEVA